jgi:hypothetical protein
MQPSWWCHVHHPRRTSTSLEARLENPDPTCFQAKQAARSQCVCNTIFILQSVLWGNRQIIARLVFRPKLRNHRDDFLGWITKPQLPVLRPKLGNPKWETKWWIPWFDCDESLTWRGLNSNPGCFVCFTFTFVSFEESCLLVLWCAAGSCGMTDSDEDHGRSRRPDAEYWGWSHRSGSWWPDDREVRWRCVRSAPYTWRQGARVCWLSLKTNVDGLLVARHQNH